MEDNELLKVRLEKIAALKADGVDLYPNDAKPQNTTAEIMDGNFIRETAPTIFLRLASRDA